ncbi:hypothetical protein ACFSO0_10465 [Brevibacillus sp. GCM10020057]|uniref:hypothetical protein n=1 Tax=Brevibacillus sp. GCM10020057 TaxID=3317327 RepID=UPI003633544F
MIVAVTPQAISELTLKHAVQKAIDNNIDIRLLRLDSESAYYTTRLTLNDTNAIKIDSITSLDSAKAKYETAADAIRDYKVAEATWKIQENAVRLDVCKAYFAVVASKEKLDVQNKYVKVREWARSSSEDAKETLHELEAKYREALAKLNQLMSEKSDKEWKFVSDSYSFSPLLSVEEYKKSSASQNAAEERYHQPYIDYLNGKASAKELAGQEESRESA